MKRRFLAAVLAATTALSLSEAPAQAQTESKQHNELIRLLETNGSGAMPNTELAGKIAGGSVNSGSSGSTAYYASQAGWGLFWVGLVGLVVVGLAQAAQQAGLVRF